MRVIVFFDLPVETSNDRREYRLFRTFLIKRGFLMLQKSVYCKLTLNQTVTNSIVEAIRKNKPKNGIVQLLIITEKQFSKMEYVLGEKQTAVVDTDQKLVIL